MTFLEKAIKNIKKYTKLRNNILNYVKTWDSEKKCIFYLWVYPIDKINNQAISLSKQLTNKSVQGILLKLKEAKPLDFTPEHIIAQILNTHIHYIASKLDDIKRELLPIINQ